MRKAKAQITMMSGKVHSYQFETSHERTDEVLKLFGKQRYIEIAPDQFLDTSAIEMISFSFIVVEPPKPPEPPKPKPTPKHMPKKPGVADVLSGPTPVPPVEIAPKAVPPKKVVKKKAAKKTKKKVGKNK